MRRGERLYYKIQLQFAVKYKCEKGTMYKNNALELGIGLGSVKILPNDD